MNRRTSIVRPVLVAASVLALTSCGGGGTTETPKTTTPPTPSAPLTGSFVDITLAGVGYATASLSGTTSIAGVFNYACTTSCETISFALGGISLGQVTGASTITLHDLTSGTDNGQLSETTVRRARLLIALDTDAEISNGIQISAEVATALASKRLDFAGATFEADLTTLIDALKADTRLTTSFRAALKAPDKYIARSLLEQSESLNRGVYTETASLATSAATEVRKYVLKVPDAFLVPYTGQSTALRDAYPRGLKPAQGAGLAIVPGTGTAPVQLRSITSRGIAVAAPQYKDGVSTRTASVLVSTDSLALPAIAVLELAPAAFDLKSTLALRASATEAFSGKPTPTGSIGSDGARNLDEALKPANPEFDQLGIDPAGLRIASDGSYWLCDRRGPQLIQLESTGRTIQRLAPAGSTGNLPGVSRLLPAVIASRQAGLGCGGVAIRPLSGEVLMASAAPLDIATQTANRARLLRVVSYNPRTGAVKQFGINNWVADSSLQLLDIDAISEDFMLGLFRYRDAATGLYQFHLRSIDLSSATDLTAKTLTTGTSAGLQLEYGTSAEVESSSVRLAPSSLVIDLRMLGWSLANPEGIARLDATTIYVIAQQNGGVTSKVVNGDATLTVSDHTVDTSGLILPRAAASGASAAFELAAASPEQRQTVLWAIKLRNPLQ